ncbi:MAG: hypothetical protein JXA52_05200 [Planctomycetes bacterium]|nr:hypothetical protein [Planctomycetota bacterium]
MKTPNETNESLQTDALEHDSSMLAMDTVLTKERPDNDDEIKIQVGEYDEDEVGEFIEIPVSTSTIPENLEIPEQLQRIIEKRLSIYRELEELEKDRLEMLNLKTLSEDVKSELSRQRRELQKLPSGQEAQAALYKLGTKLAGVAQKVKDGKSQALDPNLAHAYQLASQQWKLCMTRENIASPLLQATAGITAKEPLLLIFSRLGIKSEELFAWAVYATAIEVETAVATKKRQAIQEQLSQMKQKKHGLLARLNRASKEEEKETRRKLEQSDELYADRITFLLRELSAITPHLVKEFWQVYNEAAPCLVKNEFVGQDAVLLRAFFRYGMLSQASWSLEPEVVEHILENCAVANLTADYSLDAMNILYADEYIILASNGTYTPSIDEELELKHRNSPAWHADRLHRRLISTTYKETAYNEVLVNLLESIGDLHEKQALLQSELSNLIRNAPDYHKLSNNLKQQIQSCKVDLGRFERITKRIETQFIIQQIELREETEAKLANLEFKLTEECLADKEAAAMHRVSRLCAKLQDPFPPFALRDNFNPGSGQVNSREELIKDLQELERRDHTLFKECLLPVKKESQRIYMRYCPIILISPSCGFMGYSWNPRTNLEAGRIVVPAYCPRPGLRERMLHNLLADFRWDTSKASSGMDLLGSETLMAAYSTVRWEYRRKQKNVREKAGIYSEENDRQNFRRHYVLYLQSALDGGKKLFFKCREVYEAMVKYIPLPEGVQKLKR